jgi:hypothetical protein
MPFLYIKIITSIQGCAAETRENFTETQGNKKTFLWCPALQPRSEAEYLIYPKWSIIIVKYNNIPLLNFFLSPNFKDSEGQLVGCSFLACKSQ